MGHEPFKHHLSYAPVRQFSGTDIDNRIYDEMHTADWWWRTQEEIPDSGTIIPILLASVGLTQGSRSGCDRQPESDQNSVDNCKTMLKTKERSGRYWA